ncbi:MAG: ribonuclease HII [Chloroflexota bacterium]
MNNQRPTFAEEKILWEHGFRLVAGLDEVGRGALAGPVAAGAVILPPGLSSDWLGDVRDSKQLTPLAREYLSGKIREVALGVGVGYVSHRMIDAGGIVRATRLAMQRAVAHLAVPPESLLIDYLLLPEVPIPQRGIVKGDDRCFSIACASIVAKVARDHLMKKMDTVYPGYNLSGNKGYGTGEHIACLSRLGPCPIHRRSFQPVKGMVCRKT